MSSGSDGHSSKPERKIFLGARYMDGVAAILSERKSAAMELSRISLDISPPPKHRKTVVISQVAMAWGFPTGISDVDDDLLERAQALVELCLDEKG